ncbi:hypothetical protein H1R20_g4766, partial [Candolleomyces eurysporus]
MPPACTSVSDGDQNQPSAAAAEKAMKIAKPGASAPDSNARPVLNDKQPGAAGLTSETDHGSTFEGGCTTKPSSVSESGSSSPNQGDSDNQVVATATSAAPGKAMLKKPEPEREAEDIAEATMYKAMIKIQKERVMGDLSSMFSCNRSFNYCLHKDVVTEECIKVFLETCPLYDQEKQEWIGILDHSVDDVPSATGLIDGLAEVILAIMEELGDFGGRRYLMKTQGLRLFHQEEKPEFAASHYSSPTFVIVAEGPSFERPQHDSQGVGFGNIATCIDVITDSDVEVQDNEIAEMHTIYARQIFFQQPNRRFVQTCVIAQESLRFFHFDRSGIHHGDVYDFHSKYRIKLFIRIILGLCSLDEETLGFDTSIQWCLNADGQKVSGTLTTTDDETKVEKTYDLESVRPVFQASSIVGTGTTCWSVRDRESNKVLFIKDSWRTEHSEDSSLKPVEYENLKRARNLEGVVHMISYEADHVGWQTKNFEAVDYVPPENRRSFYARRWAENRILSRIVTELYGKDIHRSESESELLCALRDAVGGHRNLYLKAQLLHRDIAWSNIVLGKPRAPPGQEGILIDLDIAKLVSELKPEADVIGHCLFFSIGILINGISGETGDRFLTHDYLDDLQSFFYVLASIMYFYDGPSQKQRPVDRFMQEWVKHQHCGSYSLMEEHLELKKSFILSKQPTDPCKLGVGRHWSTASRKLLQGFYTFTREMALLKEGIRSSKNDTMSNSGLLAESTVRQSYDRVLQMFDIAIVELDKTTAPPSSRTLATLNVKRKADGTSAESSPKAEDSDKNRARRRKVD